jgi:hypothetical protein
MILDLLRDLVVKATQIAAQYSRLQGVRMPKYTVDIDDSLDKILEGFGGTNPKEKSDVIRNALASYIFLKQASSDPNKEVSITNTEKDNQVEQIVKLP